mgnify:CR=1 FL=1
MAKAVYPSYELVCVTAGEGAPPELLDILARRAVPNLTVLVKTRQNADTLAQIAPFSANYPLLEQGTAYYLCENGACQARTGDLASCLDKLLRRK